MASIGRYVRPLPAILLLATCLHAVGIARTRLPSQDGLTFLRVARDFQNRPWVDAIRGTDRHPLYPALVALAEPLVRPWAGRGPEAWRIAGQVVSAVAAIGLLLPLHGLTRLLFHRRVADLSALGFVLLPFPMAIGHDTLSDSLALAAFLVTLRLGLDTLQTQRLRSAIGCGLFGGLGYLVRPEILVAPLAVLTTGGFLALSARFRDHEPGRSGHPHLAGVGLTFLVMVGGYALVKGEVSEKLALRTASGIGPLATGPSITRAKGQWLPPGLDDPSWDFSPKEEPTFPSSPPVLKRLAGLFRQWAQGLGWVLAAFALWGFVRDGHCRRNVVADSPAPKIGRWLVLTYFFLFTFILYRHQSRMGYLSDRHVLTLITLSLPWAASGSFLVGTRLASLVRWRPGRSRAVARVGLACVVSLSAFLQSGESHPSRWGHLAAGHWLSRNARPGDAVLDTRGWATFLSGTTSYDYWHVRQALTDSHLRYVVVGEDEFQATSPRGATLRALLAFAAEPVAHFPQRRGGDGVGVRLFRFQQPASWEGIRP